MALADLLGRKLVIVTGKGGVGKTTVTAAFALCLAAQGKRVLCAEIASHPDTPSHLAAALGAPSPGEQPRRIGARLDAVQLTPAMGHRRFLQDNLPLKVLADAAMRSQALRKFLSAAPAFSDMGVMYGAVDLMRTGQWDVLVLDSPATGHALALAQIPQFLVRILPQGPIGRMARQGLAALTNPALTTTVVVTLPEKLAVTEAAELMTGLRQHRLDVGALVLNRVIANPFTVEETRALKAALPPRPVWGTREWARIERGQAARELLLSLDAAPFHEIAELQPASGETIAHAAAALLRGDADANDRRR